MHILLIDESFAKIKKEGKIVSLSKEEYQQYIVSLNAYRDFKNSIDTARDEGRAERDVEIAKKLKIRGMSYDKISEITDLTIEEIEKI